MEQSYKCTSVKEFNAMVRGIKPYLFTDIECIYNLSGSQFYEYPMFIFTEDNVFLLYYSGKELLIDIYPKDIFLNHVEKNRFIYPDNPAEFDYLYPEKLCPEASIVYMRPVRGCGTVCNLKGFDFCLSDGRYIYVRESDLVEGTMDSWVK